jgi:hypothetical protein
MMAMPGFVQCEVLSRITITGDHNRRTRIEDAKNAGVWLSSRKYSLVDGPITGRTSIATWQNEHGYSLIQTDPDA